MNKILHLFDYNQKLKFIILIFFMIIASFLELLGLGMVIIVLNSFLGLKNSSIELLNSYISLFFKSDLNFELILFSIFIIFTIKLVLLIFVSWMESDFMAIFRAKVSNKLFHNFLNRDVINLYKKNSAEYIRNFTEEIVASGLVISSCLKIILDFILISFFFTFLMYFNPIITLTVFIFFSLLAFFYFYLVKNKLSSWALINLENRKKKIQFISESFGAIKSIKILSRENFFLERFKKKIHSIRQIQFKVAFLDSLPRNILEYILLISILVLFYLLIKNNYSNEDIIQLISVYTLSAFRVVPLINRLLGHMQRLKHNYPSLRKLIIENEQKIKPKRNKNHNVIFKKNILLNIKNFSFSKNKDFLLKSINLEIKKKSQIGIIGQSGSGKSTIIDILCGFQKNESSKLEVDGVNIFNSDLLEGWQNLIGYVPQDIIIFNQSLRENILFGSSKKILNDVKLKNLIKKVELERFLNKSKIGLSEILKQDGKNISGGEKQRIGIARALINNPELIILDEATSGLDYQTENNILKTVKKLKKTSIIVSHRLNALKNCDKIYILKNKKIFLLNKNKLKNYFEK